MGKLAKILPLLLPLVGLGAGIGAGILLRPAPEVAEEAPAEEPDPEKLPEYVKLNNQFVVPVMEGNRIGSVVVLSLSLEVKQGMTEKVFSIEPRLRDSFLQVMFDHANAGGFSGSFTDGANLTLLRRALLEKAKAILGEDVCEVLVGDISRQDS